MKTRLSLLKKKKKSNPPFSKGDIYQNLSLKGRPPSSLIFTNSGSIGAASLTLSINNAHKITLFVFAMLELTSHCVCEI